MRLKISVYVNGALRFSERVTVGPDDDMRKLVERHLLAIGSQPHMIEFEFLDELNPQQRFLRIGTDPSRMVTPIALPI